MRKRYGLAFQDQALPETEEERQGKRSMELLRIKELALPSPSERPSIDASAHQVKTPHIVTAMPAPIVIPPSSDGLASPLLLSPPINSRLPRDPERARKTQSAYNPVTTAGMWDSGVAEGPGLKARPTSMFVMNEKKRKQDKKSERCKSKDSRNDDHERFGLKRKGDWYKYKLKLHLKGLFKREKS